MDVLSDIMRAISVRGSVFCSGEVRAPWCFSGGMTGRCLFHVVVEGEAWVLWDGEEHQLFSGDVVLLPRGFRHRVGSAPEAPAIPLGAAVETSPGGFARLVRDGGGAATSLICGTFELDGQDWHPLLRALPEVIVVDAPRRPWLSATLSALQSQIESGRLGAAMIAGRLSEVLFVQSVAAWLESSDAPSGWLSALSHPEIGRALSLIHSQPQRRWTAASLGRAVGMSRSAFYRNFSTLVGESPGRYLTEWRMTLAAKSLRAHEASIQELSERVGYASVASFTRAFKAFHGLNPGAYRGDAAP